MFDKPNFPLYELWSPILSFALDGKTNQLAFGNTPLRKRCGNLRSRNLRDTEEELLSIHLFLQRELEGSLPTSIASLSLLCDLTFRMLFYCIPNRDHGSLAVALGASEKMTTIWAECVLLSIELIDLRLLEREGTMISNVQIRETLKDHFTNELREILEKLPERLLKQDPWEIFYGLRERLSKLSFNEQENESIRFHENWKTIQITSSKRPILIRCIAGLVYQTFRKTDQSSSAGRRLHEAVTKAIIDGCTLVHYALSYYIYPKTATLKPNDVIVSKQGNGTASLTKIQRGCPNEIQTKTRTESCQDSFNLAAELLKAVRLFVQALASNDISQFSTDPNTTSNYQSILCQSSTGLSSLIRACMLGAKRYPELLRQFDVLISLTRDIWNLVGRPKICYDLEAWFRIFDRVGLFGPTPFIPLIDLCSFAEPVALIDDTDRFPSFSVPSTNRPMEDAYSNLLSVLASPHPYCVSLSVIPPLWLSQSVDDLLSPSFLTATRMFSLSAALSRDIQSFQWSEKANKPLRNLVTIKKMKGRDFPFSVYVLLVRASLLAKSSEVPNVEQLVNSFAQRELSDCGWRLLIADTVRLLILHRDDLIDLNSLMELTSANVAKLVKQITEGGETIEIYCFLAELRLYVRVLVTLSTRNQEQYKHLILPCIRWSFNGLLPLCQSLLKHVIPPSNQQVLRILWTDGIIPLLEQIILNLCNLELSSNNIILLEEVTHNNKRRRLDSSDFYSIDPRLIISRHFTDTQRHEAFASIHNPLEKVFTAMMPIELRTSALICLMMIDLLLVGREAIETPLISLPPLSNDIDVYRYHQFESKVPSVSIRATRNRDITTESLPLRVCLRFDEESGDPQHNIQPIKQRSDHRCQQQMTTDEILSSLWKVSVQNNEFFRHPCSCRSKPTQDLPLKDFFVFATDSSKFHSFFTSGLAHQSEIVMDVSNQIRESVGPICHNCFYPIFPEETHLGFSIAPKSKSTLAQRWLRIPPRFRMLCAFSGADPYRPISRKQEKTSVFVSLATHSMAIKTLQEIVDPTQVESESTSSFTTLSTSVPIIFHSSQSLIDFSTRASISSILSALFVSSDDTSFNSVLLAMTRMCLSTCPMASSVVKLLHSYLPVVLSQLPVHPSVTSEVEEKRLEHTSMQWLTTDSTQILSPVQYLLFLLESPEYCLRLLGIDYKDLSNLKMATDIVPIKGENSLTIQLLESAESKKLTNVTAQVEFWKIPFSCLQSEEYIQLDLLLIRKLLDRLRCLLVVPVFNSSLSTFNSMLAAAHFHVTEDAFTSLLQDVSRLKSRLSVTPITSEISWVFESDCFPTLVDEEKDRKQPSVPAPKDLIVKWIPSRDVAGFIARGLTPSSLSDIIFQLIFVIRHVAVLRSKLDVSKRQPYEYILRYIIDSVHSLSRALGINSLVPLLSLLRPCVLFSLLATTAKGQQSFDHFISWLYQVSVSKSLCRERYDYGAKALLGHLLRICSHPGGRSTFERLQPLFQHLCPDSVEGLVLINNFNVWCISSSSRVCEQPLWSLESSSPPPIISERLINVCISFGRRLRQISKAQQRMSIEGEAKQTDAPQVNIADDHSSRLSDGSSTKSCVRPDKMNTICKDVTVDSVNSLFGFTLISLLLRDIWDVTGPMFGSIKIQNVQLPLSLSDNALFSNIITHSQLSVLIPRVYKIASIFRSLIHRTPETPQEVQPLALSTINLLPCWEMLRFLWTLPFPEQYPEYAEKPKFPFFLKALRIFGPEAIQLPLFDEIPICKDVTMTDGVANRGYVDLRRLRKNEGAFSVYGLRVCRTVTLFLHLLGQKVVVEDSSDLNQTFITRYISVIISFLTSLSLSDCWNCHPCAIADCWATLVLYADPMVLYPFTPVLVWRLVRLRDHIAEAEPRNRSAIGALETLLKQILSEATRIEGSEQSTPIFYMQLSLYCEILLRFSRTVVGSITPSTAKILTQGGKQARNLVDRIARGLLLGTPHVLSSESICSESKAAVLEAVGLAMESLSFTSLLDLASHHGSSDYENSSRFLIEACLKLTAEPIEEKKKRPQSLKTTFTRPDSVAEKAAEVLGLFGAYYPTSKRFPLLKLKNQKNDLESSEYLSIIWWDCCPLLLAVRVAEQLLYPNLHDRFSLYLLQEVLTIIKNNDSDTCFCDTHKDLHRVASSLLSENIRHLSSTLKYFKPVITVTDHSASSLPDVLDQLVNKLLSRLKPRDAKLFILMGVQHKDFSQAVSFLLPHLLLASLAWVDIPQTLSMEYMTEVATSVNIAIQACADALDPKRSNGEGSKIGRGKAGFIRHSPTETCHIIFEAFDRLASLINIYLNTDRTTWCRLQEARKTNQLVNMSLDIPLSSEHWTALRWFFHRMKSNAAIQAAVRSGSYSRALFYLEHMYSRRIPWNQLHNTDTKWHLSEVPHRVLQECRVQSKGLTEEEALTLRFAETFKGLEDWDSVRGTFKILKTENSLWISERQLTELYATATPNEIANYHLSSGAPEGGKCELEGFRALLSGHNFSSIIFELSRAGNALRALACPIYIRALYTTSQFDLIEHLLTRCAMAMDVRESLGHHTIALELQTAYNLHQFHSWHLMEKQFSDNEDTFDLVQVHEINTTHTRKPTKTEHLSNVTQMSSVEPSPLKFALFGVIPTQFSTAGLAEFQSHLVHASPFWTMNDIASLGIAGALSALHSLQFNLARQRLCSLTSTITRHLATTSRESLEVSYPALVQLQIASDLDRLIVNAEKCQQEKQGSSITLSLDIIKSCISRVDLLPTTKNYQYEFLSTLKVAVEQIGDLNAAARLAIKLCQVVHTPFNGVNCRDPYIVPGQYNLNQLLEYIESKKCLNKNGALSSSLSQQEGLEEIEVGLRLELAKLSPAALVDSILTPIVKSVDEAAIMNLERSKHNLLPVQLLQAESLVKEFPQSSRCHSRLAECFDRIVERETSDDALKRLRPKQGERQNNRLIGLILPEYGDGRSIITLVESAITSHLEAAVWSPTVDQVRTHLLRFIQLLVDIFFWNMKVQPSDLEKQRSCKEDDDRRSIFNASAQTTFTNRITRKVQHQIQKIPQAHWYYVAPQLVARAEHPQLGGAIFQPILIRLLKYTPSQMAWHLGPLLCSDTPGRKAVAEEVLTKCTVSLSARDKAFLSRQIDVTVCFMRVLIDLAMNPCKQPEDKENKQHRSTLSITQDVPALYKVIHEVTHLPPSVQILMPLLSQLDSPHPPDKISNCIMIVGVHDQIQVMRSKQKPKRIILIGSDGKEHPWLVKQELSGDLRKDTRLMEVAGYINRWLAKKCRKRHLYARRYSVIPVNENTGFIEWLPDLMPVRSAVTDLWRTDLEQNYDSLQKKIMAKYSADKNDPTALLNSYIDIISVLPPVLHRFYLDRFGATPAQWYIARRHFIDSLALWSVFGFCVGLGDRHGENILIDMGSGEVVHVDFDCLFGKGLTLPVSEIVPFRLTLNFIATLGIGGLHGSFSAACCDVMGVLRQRKGDLLSLLQTFIFDPLIEWTRVRSSRAQQSFEIQEDLSHGHARARTLLADIERKLEGYVNFRSQRGFKSPSRRSSRSEIQRYVNEWSPRRLSIEDQVETLIEAASSPENLSLMYVGWMPWA